MNFLFSLNILILSVILHKASVSLHASAFNWGKSGAVMLKGQKKHQLNSQDDNHNLLMKHLMLFIITKKDVISELNEEVDHRSA